MILHANDEKIQIKMVKAKTHLLISKLTWYCAAPADVGMSAPSDKNTYISNNTILVIVTAKQVNSEAGEIVETEHK